MRHFKHLHSRVGCCFTKVWGAGEEERRKKGSGLLCQHLEVKMRFKILESTTCYSPPHDLKGQAAAWAGLQTWTYCLHNLPSTKTEPLSLKQMVLWIHTNQGPPSENHKNSRWGLSRSSTFLVKITCMYVCMFQNVVLRCPTPRHHYFLSSHWPSLRFLSFKAFLIPSIQFFFGLPRALFCFAIHFNAILGNLPYAILWKWPYHISWFCSISFIIGSSNPICCLIVTFLILSYLDILEDLLRASISVASTRQNYICEQIKIRLDSGRACKHLVDNLVLLSPIWKWTTFLRTVLYEFETWSFTRGTSIEKVWEGVFGIFGPNIGK